MDQKPEWITDEQWKANPNVYHWERSRAAMQSVKQMQKQPPLTREELEQQMRQRRISLGQNPKDYDNLHNEQKPTELG